MFGLRCNAWGVAGENWVMQILGEEGARSERFAELYRREYAVVMRYVRRRASADLVDDVVCDTFLVAWRRFDEVPDEPRPWLVGVARNVLATHQRGSRRRDALRERVADAGRDEVRDGDLAEDESGVVAALARLAWKDREALTLIAWDGLTPREAAQVLGEAPGTFRVRLHRARARLRRLLDQPGQATSPRPLSIGDAAHD